MQQRNFVREQTLAQPYTGNLFEEFEELAEAIPSPPQKPPQPFKRLRYSKKEAILKLYRTGTNDIAQIAQAVQSKPSYVATVLQQAGLLQGYFDLYTTTSQDQNLYSKFFRNVLSFKTPEAARESVERLDNLYRYFERLGDRAGQHHAQVLALTGRNRARWSGKKEEAQIFTEWL
ncbi:MAG: hypothetical protein AB1489_12645, partial [Acidobacteriota bacterium]